MSQDGNGENLSDNDIVSKILKEVENRDEIARLLKEASDTFTSSQQYYDAASSCLEDKDGIQSSIEYLALCKERLEDAFTAAEQINTMEKLTPEAEKEALPSIDLTNRIKTKLFEINNKKSVLENLRQEFVSGDWHLVYQYSENGQSLWPEKKEFFRLLMNLAKPQLQESKESSFFPFKSIFGKK